MSHPTEALTAYVAHVKAQLAEHMGSSADRSRAIRPLQQAPRFWFEECEKHPTWNALVSSCAERFASEGHSRAEWGWREALKH